MDNIKLTPAQSKALKSLSKGNISFTPGDIITHHGLKISRRVIRNLKKAGLVEMFDLHPWGQWPVYGITLTDLGKEIIKNESI